MKIIKLGHCCLVLEENGVKILTDPGYFTVEEVKAIRDVNVILITHEHGDHFHTDSINLVLKNNPGAKVVCNGAVAKLLEVMNVAATVVGDGQSTTINGILIEGFGRDHAIIYGEMGKCENTGYFVANKFYFPGDNFHNPGKPVDVLALPTAGPWMKLSEAIDFAKLVKPRTAFSVHDGMITSGFNDYVAKMFEAFLKGEGIAFVPLAPGEPKEF